MSKLSPSFFDNGENSFDEVGVGHGSVSSMVVVLSITMDSGFIAGNIDFLMAFINAFIQFTM